MNDFLTESEVMHKPGQKPKQYMLIFIYMPFFEKTNVRIMLE